ncbi:MAG TPA: 16S rRNA (guanine(527)-N(7))-methyltransferase RsmG [Devosia sp.]|jgi:16S rRNA (guanine527-N7)-methyltransferase|nr:16S rRNA (guanine(527)-N(7))-methyltransferase RsmG [Devosia sp.]
MSLRDDLEHYAALLRKWNAVQNLVSRETLAEIWPRHIEDSLQLVPLLRPHDRQIIDLGSGGGLPAIPMAIASRETERRFTLVEPVAKKASFLRAVARELALPVSVESVRAEQIDSRETFDVVTSRALAALPKLLGYGVDFLRPGGHMLLLKGRTFREEMALAAQLFDFDVIVHPSSTDPEAAILEISNPRAKSAV